MAASRFDKLDEFPFRRLAATLGSIAPNPDLALLDFSIGEPKHQPPRLLQETVYANGDLWNRYPPVNGTREFRQTVCGWLGRRFNLPDGMLDSERHVLPLAGTKEGLFLLPSALPPRKDLREPICLVPDPVYSVYCGAAALAGADPVPMPATSETRFLPDLDRLSADQLARTTAMYICNPANPQGSVADADYLRRALDLAEEHDFLLVLDECYSEIYRDKPPIGGLEIARDRPSGLKNLVVMHSLSKRSSAAGLRSGFIAGDPAIIARFQRFRAYGAAVQPLPLLAAATVLWADEGHVAESRLRYQAKMAIASRKLGNRFGFVEPEGGFFLWLDVGDGEAVAKKLWREAALKVLPGAYLTSGDDPDGSIGGRYIRLALVHDESLVEEALDRLVALLSGPAGAHDQVA